jgi:hypothetical protein
LSNGTSFWTSGSSDKCPNSFGWCGSSEREFISYQSLGVQSFQSATDAECVSATLQNNELVMQTEKCSTKKLMFCEVYLPVILLLHSFDQMSSTEGVEQKMQCFSLSESNLLRRRSIFRF